MQDNVTISHRGSRYEIGRGPGYYGIWRVESAGVESAWQERGRSHAIEWWTENPQGWADAWERFTGIEKSSDIVEVSLPSVAPALAGPLTGQVSRTWRSASRGGGRRRCWLDW